jgi:DNA-binding NtrC family response regulator
MLLTNCTKDIAKRQAPVKRCEAGGEPAILVVEDDSSIRRFICNLLRHTIAASLVDVADPFAALSASRRMDNPIELLISGIDLSSSMNGIDLAGQLVATNPSMKVLLMSGTDRPPAEMSRNWRFVSKPFSIQSFLECVLDLYPSSSPNPCAQTMQHTKSFRRAAEWRLGTS